MVRVKDILGWIDEHAPFRYKESWDQCGLQVGDPQAAVKRVLVALDPSSGSLDEAVRKGCDCLVTHHPLLFRPISSVRSDRFPGSVVAGALRAGVHLIAAHTNLDVARDGTNGHLARLLSLTAVEPLETEASWLDESRYVGLGRVGLLPRAVSLEELVSDTRKVLEVSAVRVVGDRRGRVHRVALCTGSGGSLVEKAIQSGSDVFITGDVKYHEAQQAVEAGLAVVDVGHFASERIVVPVLAEYLRSRAAREGADLELLAAAEESDPFWVYNEGMSGGARVRPRE
jgi:dinuclear metal center YbgI/SA1388 family protein